MPRLPHEIIEELEPEVVEVAAEIADCVRRLSREDVARVIDRREIEGDLGFRWLVRAPRSRRIHLPSRRAPSRLLLGRPAEDRGAPVDVG